MAIIVSGIALPFEEPEGAALERALQILGRPPVDRIGLAKKSVDARRRDRIQYVYSVAVELPGGRELAERLGDSRVVWREAGSLELGVGTQALAHPPVIVGLGPAGLFAALVLARRGLRPVVFERGGDVDSRVAAVESFWRQGCLNVQSNVQFGEGGAGTFSDGKLTCRIGDLRTGFVLDELARHGAPEDIRWQAKPHVGTDLLRSVVRSIREEIVRLGGQVHFQTQVTGLKLRHGALCAVRTAQGETPADVAVLAPGHSARDTFSMLWEQGAAMESKPFSVGVRIEHHQERVDRALYGGNAGHPALPPGEYQLSHRRQDRAVYTFCMCPGGVVVPAASQTGGVVTNGMSYHARDGKNANAALVVSVDARDFGPAPLDGAAFQQRLEEAAFRVGGGDYRAPAQTADRFLEGRAGANWGKVAPSYARGVAEADFSALLPGQVVELLREGLRVFDRRLSGFAGADSVLTGPETRTSSPVRILRGDCLEAVGLQGLYPCGEGAGYAGGIVSAAVDGVRVAQAIVARYRAPD